jgi:hypothetical protein
VKQIPLTRGYVALVDDEDYERVMAAGPWCARPDKRTVYAQRRLPLPGGRQTTQSLHAFLTGWPQVDHNNGDGLDNRKCNLRPATHEQNAANRRLNRNSTSGYKGVTRVRGRWLAQIQASKKHRHLGYFDSPEDAARAYDRAARELFGAYARPNFPEEQVA